MKYEQNMGTAPAKKSGPYRFSFHSMSARMESGTVRLMDSVATRLVERRVGHLEQNYFSFLAYRVRRTVADYVLFTLNSEVAPGPRHHQHFGKWRNFKI